jgi:thiamine biosynthesis protein ThiS
MTITLNGESKSIENATGLLALMAMYELNPEATAVQYNDDILERDVYASITLSDGDRVELIRIVGGG